MGQGAPTQGLVRGMFSPGKIHGDAKLVWLPQRVCYQSSRFDTLGYEACGLQSIHLRWRSMPSLDCMHDSREARRRPCMAYTS